jgi:hypothetical protein
VLRFSAWESEDGYWIEWISESSCIQNWLKEDKDDKAHCHSYFSRMNRQGSTSPEAEITTAKYKRSRKNQHGHEQPLELDIGGQGQAEQAKQVPGADPMTLSLITI